jgi:hypothetical protein
LDAVRLDPKYPFCSPTFAAFAADLQQNAFTSPWVCSYFVLTVPTVKGQPKLGGKAAPR